MNSKPRFLNKKSDWKTIVFIADYVLVAVVVRSFWVCQRDSFCIGLPKNEIPNHLRILSRKNRDFLRAGGGRVGGEEGERHTELPALIIGMRVDRGGGRLNVKTVSLHLRIPDLLFKNKKSYRKTIVFMEDSGLVAVVVRSFWVCQRDSFLHRPP